MSHYDRRIATTPRRDHPLHTKPEGDGTEGDTERDAR